MISVRDRFESFQQIHQLFTPNNHIKCSDAIKPLLERASSTSDLTIIKFTKEEEEEEEECNEVENQWIELTKSDIEYLKVVKRPELEKFLAQITGIREDLRNLKTVASKIKKFHEKLRNILLLRGAERDFVRMMIRELDREVEKFQSSSQKICRLVNTINDEFKQADREGMSQAEFRIRRDQILCVVEALKTVINQFNHEQIQYESENREKAARMIKSRSLEAQYAKRIEKEGLLTFISDQSNLPGLLEELKDRHEACLRLEASTDELSNMFQELKLQLETSSPLLNDIQTNVNQCEEYTDKTKDNVIQIKKKMETKKKISRGVSALALVLMVGLLIALLLNFSGVILLLLLK